MKMNEKTINSLTQISYYILIEKRKFFKNLIFKYNKNEFKQKIEIYF